MSSSKNDMKQQLGRMVAELVEVSSADAVIIGITRQRNRTTETIAVPFGNMHACRGVAEFIYAQLCEGFDEEEEDGEADDNTPEKEDKE